MTSSLADLSNNMKLNIKGLVWCLEETFTLTETASIILQIAINIKHKYGKHLIYFSRKILSRFTFGLFILRRAVRRQSIAIVLLQSGSQFMSRNESEETVLFSNLAAQYSEHNFFVHAIRRGTITNISQSTVFTKFFICIWYSIGMALIFIFLKTYLYPGLTTVIDMWVNLHSV